ncbi:MAG: hypothetical protein AB7K14_15265 [Lysobacterales bacterium]
MAVIDGYSPQWRVVPAATMALVFLVGISLPWIGLLREQPAVLAFENRGLTAFPEKPRDFQQTLTWPKQFEAWFSDRTWGREQAFSISRSLLLQFAGRAPTERILIGKNGFMFFKGEEADAFDKWFLGRPAYTADNLTTFRNEFERRRRWFTEQGMRYYLVVVPEKFSIYPEMVPSRFGGDHHVKRLEQIERVMEGVDGFLSLRPELLKSKSSELLYYRTDSHWNGRGALLGYHAIIKMLRRDFPSLEARSSLIPPPGDDFYIQDLANMIGNPDLGTPERLEMRDFYHLAKLKPAHARQVELAPTQSGYAANWAAERWLNDAPQVPVKVLVLRDSTSNPLRPSLADHFAESVFLTTHRYDKATITSERPAVVLEIIVERGAGGLIDGYFSLQEAP